MREKTKLKCQKLSRLNRRKSASFGFLEKKNVTFGRLKQGDMTYGLKSSFFILRRRKIFLD